MKFGEAIKRTIYNGKYKKILLLVFAAIIVAGLVTVLFITVNSVQKRKAEDDLISGDRYMNLKLYDKAEASYLSASKSAALKETTTDRIINLYTLWANDLIKSQAQTDEIIAVLEKLLNYTPDDTDLIYALASLYSKKEDYAHALELCLKVLEISPDDERAISYYAETLLNDGKRKECANFYEEKYASMNEEKYHLLALSLYPTSPVFDREDGSFSKYFTATLHYEPLESEINADEPITEDDIMIIYTVGEGKSPDYSRIRGTTVDETIADTYVYNDGINLEYYANGGEIVVTAVAVDKYGMMSEPAVARYRFTKSFTAIKSASISKPTSEIEENEQFNLHVYITPTGATNQNIIWSSSDTNFAVVDNNGFVKAVNYTENEDREIRSQVNKVIEISAYVVSTGETYTCKVTIVPKKTVPSSVYSQQKAYTNFDFGDLNEETTGVVGYLTMEGLGYCDVLPTGLLFTDRNDGYYLNHDMGGNDDSGEMVLYSGGDYTKLEKNTVIRAEYSETKLLMNGISEINYYPKWYLNGKNHYIYLNTLTNKYIFQVFSWYHPDGSFVDYEQTEFGSNTEFVNFCRAAKKANQLFNMANASFSSSDKLITMILCKDGVVDTVLHGRMVRATEGFTSPYEVGEEPKPQTPTEKPTEIPTETVLPTEETEPVETDAPTEMTESTENIPSETITEPTEPAEIETEEPTEKETIDPQKLYEEIIKDLIGDKTTNPKPNEDETENEDDDDTEEETEEPQPVTSAPTEPTEEPPSEQSQN